MTRSKFASDIVLAAPSYGGRGRGLQWTKRRVRRTADPGPSWHRTGPQSRRARSSDPPSATGGPIRAVVQGAHSYLRNTGRQRPVDAIPLARRQGKGAAPDGTVQPP